MADVNPYAEQLGDRNPFEVIKSTPALLVDLLRGKSEAELAVPTAPGKWSLHQIVAHLADGEFVFQARMRWILFEDNPPLIPFDQDKWTAGWNREGETFQQTLERYRVLRDATLRLVNAAPVEDMKRSGTHSEMGRITADDVLRIIAGHDCHHIAGLQRLFGVTA